MKIVIVGCSGFVGMELKAFFEGQGKSVFALKVRRDTPIEHVCEAIEGTDVLINLAGLSIFGRWDEAYKKALYTSRIETTRKLIEAIKLCQNRPLKFLSTSAVGIYPNDVVCDESTAEFSSSYLAHICIDWEKEALKAEAFGVCTSILRFGVILGKKGGMIQKIRFPFSLGLGGRIGSGEQPLSWIHIDDLCEAYMHVIENKNPVCNLCAPEAISNIEFTKILGSLMHRPTFFPVPAFVLRLIFNEGANFMLEGQRAYPKGLLESGFEFKYPTIREALKSLL